MSVEETECRGCHETVECVVIAEADSDDVSNHCWVCYECSVRAVLTFGVKSPELEKLDGEKSEKDSGEESSGEKASP